MAKKTVKKPLYDIAKDEPIHPRCEFDIMTGLPLVDPVEEAAKRQPEPEPEKSVEEKVEDEILAVYGDIPRGATELYLRAILRELVRARIK